MDNMNPLKAAERGEEIYQRKYKSDFEHLYPGKFVAINIATENAYVGDSPEDAITKAQEAREKGMFHLIKVGATGAFRVSYTSNASMDGIFR